MMFTVTATIINLFLVNKRVLSKYDHNCKQKNTRSYNLTDIKNLIEVTKIKFILPQVFIYS